MRSCLILSAGVSLSGCYFLYGTDGFTSDAPEQDAGEPPSAPVVDAGLDSSANAETGFCANHLNQSFCDDFDTADLASLWNAIGTKRGSVARNQDAFASAPYSLLATAGVGPMAFGAASVTKVIPGTHRIQVRGRLRAEQRLEDVNLIYVWFRPPPPGFSWYEVSLWVESDGTPELEHAAEWLDGGAPKEQRASFSEMFSEWRDVLIDVADGHASLTIDGVKRAGVSLIPASAQGFEVELGIAYAGATESAQSVRWDDVVIDAE